MVDGAWSWGFQLGICRTIHKWAVLLTVKIFFSINFGEKAPKILTFNGFSGEFSVMFEKADWLVNKSVMPMPASASSRS